MHIFLKRIFSARSADKKQETLDILDAASEGFGRVLVGAQSSDRTRGVARLVASPLQRLRGQLQLAWRGAHSDAVVAFVVRWLLSDVAGKCHISDGPSVEIGGGGATVGQSHRHSLRRRARATGARREVIQCDFRACARLNSYLQKSRIGAAEVNRGVVAIAKDLVIFRVDNARGRHGHTVTLSRCDTGK